MKQKLVIFLVLILLVAVLAGLNAASYVQKEKMPDSEMMPNRSTYNSGATGTQAFYTLLAETGRKVVRWQEPPGALLASKQNRPATFVIIGSIRREFSEADVTQLLRWVSEGGKLVIIDRQPPQDLVTTTSNWKISFSPQNEMALFSVDPSDQKQMTSDTPANKPVQPTVFTKNVNAVQTSRFASTIGFERFADIGTGKKQNSGLGSGIPPPKPQKTQSGESNTGNGKLYTVPTPTPVTMAEIRDDNGVPPDFNSPVVHVAGGDKNLLVDVPFGQGQIVFLGDPYIVSNGGINLVDNAQLAVNVVASNEGTIAFDEYHQGYGSNNNRFFQYFEGTPVVAIFLQCAILAAVVFYSQSRRFARPLPEREPDRLSKLEYVSAMAEVQQRTKAYDLAIENIYKDFRRRVAKLLGVDNYTATRKEIAGLIGERIKFDRNEVEDTMFKCEEIIHGEPTNKREIVELSGRLREIEEKLGLKRLGKTRI